MASEPSSTASSHQPNSPYEPASRSLDSIHGRAGLGFQAGALRRIARPTALYDDEVRRPAIEGLKDVPAQLDLEAREQARQLQLVVEQKQRWWDGLSPRQRRRASSRRQRKQWEDEIRREHSAVQEALEKRYEEHVARERRRRDRDEAATFEQMLGQQSTEVRPFFALCSLPGGS